MHTDEFVEVLARIRPESVTVAVVGIIRSCVYSCGLTLRQQIMDHMDWFNPEGTQAAEVR